MKLKNKGVEEWPADGTKFELGVVRKDLSGNAIKTEAWRRRS